MSGTRLLAQIATFSLSRGAKGMHILYVDRPVWKSKGLKERNFLFSSLDPWILSTYLEKLMTSSTHQHCTGDFTLLCRETLCTYDRVHHVC